jgi:hypothetical protein
MDNRPGHGGLLVATVLLFACQVAPALAEPAPPEPQAPAGATAPVHLGTVVETMDASVYTYVLLRGEDGQERWFAGPKAPVKVGDRLSLSGGAEMREFRSPTLKRTFPVLYMVGSLGVAGSADTAGGAPHPKLQRGDSPAQGPRACPAGHAHPEPSSDSNPAPAAAPTAP